MEEKVECRAVEERIVSEESLTFEEQMHLLNCPRCQDFSLAHEAIVHNGMPVPSSENDARALDAASSFGKRFRKQRRLFHFLGSAAAALFLVSASLAYLDFHGREAVQYSTMSEQWMLDCSLASEEMSELEHDLSMAVASADSELVSKDDLGSGMSSLQSELLSLEMDINGLF